MQNVDNVFYSSILRSIIFIVIIILIGLSVFMAPMLSNIPMPVLFGLFLFMGVASLNGLQMFDRLCLFFMPKKYQPDLTYLRRVPISRVHLFTTIQLLSLAGLWIVKDIKSISILFPIMVSFIQSSLLNTLSIKAIQSDDVKINYIRTFYYSWS